MEKTESGRQSGRRHALVMVLCCLVPVVVLGILWASGVSKSYLVIGLLVLCPLLHIVMMPGIFKRKDDAGGHYH